ncbi:hypothetical protein Scep_023204 [Stephania cephalantha]|uniref:DNA ligase n=1 Tax=Stephania cephalantha TaxID=152367 RepID=A0AAP0F394_9MAGN
MSTGSVKFSVICSLFTWMQRSKSTAKKRSKFRKFLDAFCKSGDSDCFSAVRLILPSLDRDRGTYGLKESVLATCLIDALGVSRESDDALRLVNWRKGGARTGPNVGNFSLVAAEVLQRRQTLASGGLTIKDVNDSLDRLAACENRTEKTSVLSDLIKKTNAQEMKWIVMIILKDLKLGVSEKSIFHEFHPDAEDLFNVTCDLKLVCEKLRDRSQRHKRQDIEVGKAVRPQLATRVSNAASAWKKLHGKEVIAECKFDGDRIQIHKNGAEIHFFSRNFLDHAEYGPGMSNVIMQSILVDRCILDGEMLVWDTSCNRFAEFGSNQEIAKAAKEGFDSDRQLCYVAFDILYVGDTSVIHQSLKERHELLQKVVKPLKGRMEILVPNGGLNANRTSGEPCWSIVARSLEEVERFFKDTIENRDEGIVLKDLGSKWDPGDRSGKWLKLKPDYIHPGSDLDVLIIGGYYGSGRRGGQVAQFLVGLAEQSAPDTYPKRFMSFCRVGTGLSDDELDTLTSKLKPYFRYMKHLILKNEYPKKTPSFYEVTNNSKERPDVWIDSPEKSIILSITSDIRTIKSEVFAAPYSLRFPRVDRVRYDKPWHECLDVQCKGTFILILIAEKWLGADYNDAEDNKPKRIKSSRKGKLKKKSVVPSHFMQTDISGVCSDVSCFLNMFTHCIAAEQKDVTFFMMLNDDIDHLVILEYKGGKRRLAIRMRTPLIHVDCALTGTKLAHLLTLHGKFFVNDLGSFSSFLFEAAREHGTLYLWPLWLGGLSSLLNKQTNLSTLLKSKSAHRIRPDLIWDRRLCCCCCCCCCCCPPLNVHLVLVLYLVDHYWVFKIFATYDPSDGLIDAILMILEVLVVYHNSSLPSISDSHFRIVRLDGNWHEGILGSLLSFTSTQTVFLQPIQLCRDDGLLPGNWCLRPALNHSPRGRRLANLLHCWMLNSILFSERRSATEETHLRVMKNLMDYSALQPQPHRPRSTPHSAHTHSSPHSFHSTLHSSPNPLSPHHSHSHSPPIDSHPPRLSRPPRRHRPQQPPYSGRRSPARRRTPTPQNSWAQGGWRTAISRTIGRIPWIGFMGGLNWTTLLGFGAEIDETSWFDLGFLRFVKIEEAADEDLGLGRDEKGSEILGVSMDCCSNMFFFLIPIWSMQTSRTYLPVDNTWKRHARMSRWASRASSRKPFKRHTHILRCGQLMQPRAIHANHANVKHIFRAHVTKREVRAALEKRI